MPSLLSAPDFPRMEFVDDCWRQEVSAVGRTFLNKEVGKYIQRRQPYAGKTHLSRGRRVEYRWIDQHHKLIYWYLPREPPILDCSSFFLLRSWKLVEVVVCKILEHRKIKTNNIQVGFVLIIIALVPHFQKNKQPYRQSE